MEVAIMQPTYFPWIGYFSLIKRVDKFIFLDNVQFSRRSWQQRNKIADQNKILWLSVPVIKKNLYNQKISEVKVFDQNFKKKHLNMIKHCYSKTKYFKNIFPIIENIFNKDFDNLSDWNQYIINKICEYLEIKTHIVTASKLNSSGKKDELLSNICRELKAEKYIAVYGSEEYMSNSNKFKKNNIKVEYFDFKEIKYSRGKNDYISKLSIIDLLFFHGEKSLNYI